MEEENKSFLEQLIDWFGMYFDIPLQAKLRDEEEDRERKQVIFPQYVNLERYSKQQ